MKTSLYEATPRVCFAAALAMLLHQLPAVAQGNFSPIMLHTGSGEPLVSAEQPLGALPDTPVEMEFEFGFATSELFAPDAFFDSFTVTLQDEASNFTLVILTVDASGVVWVPVTPGTIVLDPNLINRVPIPFPEPPPGVVSELAFAVSFSVPVQFGALHAMLFLDLFDNLDPAQSQAYFQLKAVPEPSVLALAMAGGLIGWLYRRARA